MRFVIYSDPHWSRTSSIWRGKGERFTTRLENLIQSINWVEQLAEDSAAEAIVCAGDFFDRPDLTSEEISALNEIKWSDGIRHFFLVGNHESPRADLSISSTEYFRERENFEVISEVSSCGPLLFIPYIKDSKEHSLSEYTKGKSYFVISHNDLQIQYGKYLSKEGFSLEDIKAHCKYFFNGHLHNRAELGDGIVNIGNLTGQNFSENSTHGAYIVDLDEMSVTAGWAWISNPYATHFMTVSFEGKSIEDIETQLRGMSALYPQIVLTAVVDAENASAVGGIIKKIDNILETRIISHSVSVREEAPKAERSFDYITQFKEYAIQKLGDSPIIRKVLVDLKEESK